MQIISPAGFSHSRLTPHQTEGKEEELPDLPLHSFANGMTIFVVMTTLPAFPTPQKKKP